MQEVHAPLQPGTTIRGRYVVENVLGNRSFGSVYLVKDQRHNQKQFVLKEVPDPGWKNRFQIPFGSKWFKRLEHSALPQVYQVFNDGRHGQAYMLVDYIEGPNLEILQQGQPEQRFSLSYVVSLIAPIMNAVTYLHSQHHPIIHGDIKPSNIILRKEDGATVLVGFGLVKEAATDTDTDTTLTFDRYGSPGFKAPEQYSGETDPRADIYELGAVLYSLLTGTVPAGALYRVRRLVEKKPDPLFSMNQIAPDIPTGIASAIHRAMSINRNDRYSTVEQFWNALWQEPIYNSIVQYTQKQLNAPPAAGNRELDANLTEEDATELVDATSTKERNKLDANLTKANTTKDLNTTPTKERNKLDTDPPLRPITKSTVAILAEQAPVLNAQVAGSVIASIDPAHEPVLSEEVKRPITAPLQEQSQNYHFRNSRKIFPLSLASLVTLLLIIGVGTSLWFYTAGHGRFIAALPISAPQLKSTPSAIASTDSKATVTPSPATIIYPKVAASYNGTIFDIVANVSTKMSLSDIQQQQGNIRGNITGLRWNGPFQGFIDTAKYIQFSLTVNVGQATLSFEGSLRSDGNVAGTYCSMNLARDCSDYGIWSVAPVV